MSNRIPHLWIRAERVRAEPVNISARGDSYLRDDLTAHSRRLFTVFNESIDILRNKKDFDIAAELVVEITTAAGRAVSKEQLHLSKLGFRIVAQSVAESNIAIAILPREKLLDLQKRLETYASSRKHRGKSNFAAIDSIKPVGLNAKVSPGLLEREEPVSQCLITLYASLAEQTKEATAIRIVSRLNEDGVDARVHHYANGVVAISASLSEQQIRGISEDFMLVRTIESDALLVDESAIDGEAISLLVERDSPACEMPIVVIDSGINSTNPLLSGLVKQVLVELPPGCVGPHLQHGTFVGSRAAYGDDIHAIGRRASPWCPLIDVQVTGDDGLGNRVLHSASALGDVIQKVVPLLAGESRVFNLSMNLTQPIIRARYSNIARLIDYLSRELKVLFVISAGNFTPLSIPPSHFGGDDSRMLSPAESLLSLSVGSIARHTDVHCVSQVGELSAFSRRGPGADGGPKPEVAAHGGNTIFDGIGAAWRTSPRVAVYGISRDGSRFCHSVGTSYAAPLISQYAARLFSAYDDATPNLVRALLCHFAKSIAAPAAGAPLEDWHFCGFGEPDIESALYSSSSSATFLFQGEIAPDTFIYLPFHVPQALVDAADAGIRIRATIVFDPPVSQDDAAHYSQCRVSALLRKRSGGGLRDVAIGGEDDDSRFPWNPTLQFSRTFKRGFSSGEWELRLRLFTRGQLIEHFKQTFAVVIEVIDGGGAVDTRGAIDAEFPGIYSTVQLTIAA